VFYDHRSKVANQADVFKHLALVTLLSELVSRHQPRQFRYVDLYAGYPEYPLASSRRWRKGLGKLADVPLCCDTEATRFWLQQCVEILENSHPVYPGSSLLAYRLLNNADKESKLALWDVDPMATLSLRDKFGDQAEVFTGEGDIEHPEVSNADFVFVDPPGLRSQRFADFPAWNWLASIMTLAADQLIWLPIVDNRKMRPDPEPEAVRDTAGCMGLSVTEIRWKGRNMVGCQLLYRAPDKICAELQRVLSWATGFFSNCTVSHFPELRSKS